jgi:hypothetical protein
MKLGRMAKPAESVVTVDLLEDSTHFGTAARPVMLFVLGMHRSGTSAPVVDVSASRVRLWRRHDIEQWKQQGRCNEPN